MKSKQLAAPVGATHQVPQTCVCPLWLLPNLDLLHQGKSAFLNFLSGLKSIRLLKAGLTSKHRGKKLLSTLTFSIPFIPIQLQAHVFLSLPFDIHVLLESFLVALLVPCQTQLHVSLGFSNLCSCKIKQQLYTSLVLPIPAPIHI